MALPAERILHSIHLFRKERVLLDADLATLYGVETRVLIQAVKRNLQRFPVDFMFQLTADEAAGLRFQFGTLKRGQNIKYLPHVFTQEGVAMLESVWGEFRTHQVYRTDVAGVLARAWRFITTMVFGRMRRDLPVSLLDNSPLRELLQQRLTMSNVQEGIDRGHLRALCITASGYSSGESVSFFQGVPSLDTWRRSRRIGVNTEISIDHLMASAAIPIFFPAVRVNREFFGDGALRQLSPMSPALHLGAERVLVIGVGGQSHRQVRPVLAIEPGAIGLDARTVLPAQQLAHRLFERLAYDVPQRHVDARAAWNIVEHLRKQRGATGALPNDRLLLVEVYTPSGNWSSYPPHKHDVHRTGPGGAILEADLEEVYFYKIRPAHGFALQRTQPPSDIMSAP